MIMLYSIEIRVVQFTGLGEAIIEQIGNRVGLTFANFTERPLLIRATGKNFNRPEFEGGAWGGAFPQAEGILPAEGFTETAAGAQGAVEKKPASFLPFPPLQGPGGTQIDADGTVLACFPTN